MKSVRVFGAACVLALAFCGSSTPAPVPPPPKDTPKLELARLAGRWKLVSRITAGEELVLNNPNAGGEMIAVFKEDGTFAWEGGVENLGKIARIDPSKSPKEIDYEFKEGGSKGKTQKALYKLEGDTYSDCCTEPGEDRPTEFKSTKENGYEIMVFQRIKKND
jgi:uncharacterized protein (TIGR03067 family)